MGSLCKVFSENRLLVDYVFHQISNLCLYERLEYSEIEKAKTANAVADAIISCRTVVCTEL